MISQTKLNTSQNNIAFKGNLTKIPINQLLGKAVTFDPKIANVSGNIEAIRGTGIHFNDILTITKVKQKGNHTTLTIKNAEGIKSGGWGIDWFDCHGFNPPSLLSRCKDSLIQKFSK